MGEYTHSFDCLEHASDTLVNFPKLWFYMGVVCLKEYTKQMHRRSRRMNHSDLYNRKINYPSP